MSTEIDDLKQKVELLKRQLTISLDKNKKMHKKLRKLQNAHSKTLRSKRYYKLQKGPSVYIVKNEDEHLRFKIGSSINVNTRFGDLRTLMPGFQLCALVYTTQHRLLESSVLQKFRSNLLAKGREIIVGVDLDVIVQSMRDFTQLLNLESNFLSQQQLDDYNNGVDPSDADLLVDGDEEQKREDVVEDTKSDELDDADMEHKRCGGPTHESEEDRFMHISNFHQNQANKDGVQRFCIRCLQHLRKTALPRVTQTIPEHDRTTHKWCGLCKTVKAHSEFHKDKATEFGIQGNCKACKAKQKRKLNESRKVAESEIIKNGGVVDTNVYQCKLCEKKLKSCAGIRNHIATVHTNVDKDDICHNYERVKKTV